MDQQPTGAVQQPETGSRDRSLRRAVKSLIKGVLPASLIREIRQYRRFKPAEKPMYMKLRLMNELGRRKPQAIPSGARSFLFLCFGNIMRSPMCEALMKRALADIPDNSIRVTSAGLNATAGTAAHPWALAAARDFGVSLDEHRSTLVTAAMLEEADVIFLMDYQNLVHLHSRYPIPQEKVFLLGRFAQPSRFQIPDPFYLDQEGTRQCYSVLQQCIDNIVAGIAHADRPRLQADCQAVMSSSGQRRRDSSSASE